MTALEHVSGGGGAAGREAAAAEQRGGTAERTDGHGRIGPPAGHSFPYRQQLEMVWS